MPEIKDVLPKVLADYVSENKENVITESVRKEIEERKSALDDLIRNIDKQFRAQRVI
jgi:hypothetical protein